MKKTSFICLLCIAFCVCGAGIAQYYTPGNFETIPASPQRTGNADSGYQYLITGDYLKSGLPLNLFFMGRGADKANLLERTGDNAKIPFDFTAVKAANGETVVAPNCLQCHAQMLDGKLIVGLGNSFSDFTQNMRGTAAMAETLIKAGGVHSRKYEASKQFLTAVKTLSPQLVTSTKGVNLADGLAMLLAAHRDPATFAWKAEADMEIPQQLVPTDVPAWWMLKKKHAMFYNGFGRGDFGRFLMASNLLTVTDTAEAAEVDTHFGDVLAWLNTLQPPIFPKPVNEGMAAKGRQIFTQHCGGCHGSYGKNAMYPNLLIPGNVIRTDSLLYSANYSSPQFVNWFNNSWFTTGDHPAKLVPFAGYLAPPLDGVWATAPYLHNGSVPNLEALLNSKLRPTYWERDFNKPLYQYDIPGWAYTQKDKPGGKNVYNTTLPGFRNDGHYFGDQLTESERRSVIEYLKTL